MKYIVALAFFIMTTVAQASNIVLVVPGIAGGGPDISGRLVARHIGKHLPGNPTVTVSNMQGAGGLVMTNWLYNVADQENTIALLNANNDVILNGLLGNENSKYDLKKFNWLFSAEDGENNVFVLWANRKRGLINVDLMLTSNDFVVGNQGSNNILTYFLTDVVRSKSRIIHGYKDVRQALIVNEIDARFGTLSSVKANFPSWLKEGNEIHPILQVGSKRRHPELPQVPNVREFTTDPSHLAVLDFYERQVRLARLIFAGPNMSKERAQQFISAGVALEKDIDYLTEAKKLEMEGDFMQHKETMQIMSEIMNTSTEVLKIFKQTSGR
jgi:tripartite-type tricarboxylate transporter receptor subunit TctC